MSTLKVTNIQATGETATRAVSGVAAAWVNFNGTGTAAIRDSVNVASLTDNGTGDYTVNFNSSMSNNSYSTSGDVMRDVATTTTNVSLVIHLQSTGSGSYSSMVTTGAVRITCKKVNTYTTEDPQAATLSAHGDLA